MSNTNINQINTQKITKFSTQCSNICVQNWTKYKQTIPIGHYCSCTKKQFFTNINLNLNLNLNTKSNLKLEQIDS